jgi:hypothetical protein
MEQRKVSGTNSMRSNKATPVQRTLDAEHQARMTRFQEELAKSSSGSLHQDEIDYLLHTGPILLRYYDIVERASECGDKPVVGSAKSDPHNIMRYFVEETVSDKGNSTSRFTDLDQEDDRATLLEKYMSITDPTFQKSGAAEVFQSDMCVHCGETDRNVLVNDGMIFCPHCCTAEYIIVDHDKPAYKDPPKEVSYFAYKRINHFQEWLNQVQGKETTDIPEEVYDRILLEIKKQKITNLASLNSVKMKEILKKLRINKYYEHTAFIINKLNGIPIPHLSPELESVLRSMFQQIQVPFARAIRAGGGKIAARKNFLSYGYCLHKMVQLLGHDEYLKHFPLLKSREKLHQQDVIWKRICEDLGWEFVCSL